MPSRSRPHSPKRNSKEILMHRWIETEGEDRSRGRERERDRQTDRQTDRDRDRKREREKGRGRGQEGRKNIIRHSEIDKRRLTQFFSSRAHS